MAAQGVVHALLFYSPSCPHCHKIMTEDLPPLLEEHGAQLDIVVVDTAHPDGNAIYQAAIERFNITPERRGVPTLIVGNNVLVGSLEIPEQFPALIETYLAEGGVGWPDIPGFVDALNEVESAEPTVEVATTTPYPAQEATLMPPVSENAGPGELNPAGQTGAIRDITDGVADSAISRFRQDIVGNSLSVLVLIGMVILVAWIFLCLAGSPQTNPESMKAYSRAQWVIPILVLGGLFVSVYMAYVETTHTAAVCGPVGDCNTVQQSEYAMLFGLIPMGLVGIAGYAALGATWFMATFSKGHLAQWASFFLPAMALVGTLFSIYLTFLEPFVIGATCLWCLTSAVTISLILWLSAKGGRRALATLSAGSSRRRWQGSQS